MCLTEVRVIWGHREGALKVYGKTPNPKTASGTMARNRQTTERDQLAIQRRVLTIRFLRGAGAKAEEEPKARARRRVENFMLIVVAWNVPKK